MPSTDEQDCLAQAHNLGEMVMIIRYVDGFG